MFLWDLLFRRFSQRTQVIIMLVPLGAWALLMAVWGLSRL